MELAEQYRDLDDERLLAIVADPTSYRPEAVLAAQAELKDRGIDVEVPGPPSREELAEDARRLREGASSNTFWGGLLLALGLVFTIGTLVGSGGDIVYVWYGAIIGGGWMVFRGLSQGDAATRLEAESHEPPSGSSVD